MSQLYQHHRGLKDARILRTPHLVRIGEVLGMGVVHGDAGQGKTFSVGTHLVRIAKQLEVTRIVASLQPTENRLLRQIITACSGAPAEGTAYTLYDEAIRELSLRPRLLVIDEAQNLAKQAVECVRHLHDSDETSFGLLLVGGNGCWDALSSYPMLRSRVDDRVQLTPLTEAQILRFIPQYHPIYVGVPKELLLLINDSVGHGSFRRWASFTRKAYRLCQRLAIPQIDEDVIRQVFVSQAGGVHV